MYDIITFGSAAQDIHIKSRAFKILDDGGNFVTGKGICLPLGSKIDVEDIIFTSGGSGTNTAATFAKQGFKVAFCGAIGVDVAGLEIVRELRHLRIDTKFLVKKRGEKTTHSIVISSAGEDRTILIYRGASGLFNKNDILWKKIIKTKWIYLAPLSGQSCDIFEDIVNFAKENKIKVAVNPSKQQLSMAQETLKDILQKVDVLFLNQEEASFLTKVPFDQEQNIFKKVSEFCLGVVVMTKGGKGAVASDGKYLYSAPGSGTIKTKIVDTTGAGDAFASGFLTDYIRFAGDIEKAMQMGLANGLANLTQIGAKTGILEKNTQFERIQVAKSKI